MSVYKSRAEAELFMRARCFLEEARIKNETGLDVKITGHVAEEILPEEPETEKRPA